MTWILTGGAGFLGSAFLRKLNDSGIRDVIVVDQLESTDKWKNLRGKKFEDFIPIAQFRRCLEHGGLSEFGKIQFVMHLGASSSTTVRDGDYLIDNNTIFTRELAVAAIKHDARFIYTSSAATYGDGELGFKDDEQEVFKLRPQNMYGYSKQLFDEWAISSGMIKKITGLKFFNAFGPNEYHKADQRSMINKAFDQIKKSGRLTLFRSHHPKYRDGESLRDFVYVKDCLDPMFWLAENRNVNGVYNLGTGKARSWNDLARAIFAAMKLPEQIDYVDIPENIRDRYQYFTEANMDKLRATSCPLSFRSLEDSVKDYIQNHLQMPDPYY